MRAWCDETTNASGILTSAQRRKAPASRCPAQRAVRPAPTCKMSSADQYVNPDRSKTRMQTQFSHDATESDCAVPNLPSETSQQAALPQPASELPVFEAISQDVTVWVDTISRRSGVLHRDDSLDSRGDGAASTMAAPATARDGDKAVPGSSAVDQSVTLKPKRAPPRLPPHRPQRESPPLLH